jgi:DNA repair protein RecO (recombination protein O)
MNRNLKTPAISLKAGRFGEIHKQVTLFTPGEGILRGTAYGAYKGKGKLGGTTEPFTWGMAGLYHDPVKDTYKITDFEVYDQFENIRGNLRKYYCASLWAEILLKSYGGGGSPELFRLTREGLTLLNSVETRNIDGVLIQYLWKALIILGSGPDLSSCANCEGSISGGSWALDLHKAGAICGSCIHEGAIVLEAGARRYLIHTSSLGMSEALKINLQEKAMGELKNALFSLFESILEVPLNTLKSGLL